MSELETNDWIVINNIIYDIYTIKNIEEMQRKFLEHLMSIVEYDAGDFCLASKESVAGIDSVVAYGYDGRDVIKVRWSTPRPRWMPVSSLCRSWVSAISAGTMWISFRKLMISRKPIAVWTRSPTIFWKK